MRLRWKMGYGALSVAVLVLGLESRSAAQRQDDTRGAAVGATVSVTGCLLDERTYAAARGLAKVGSGTGPQLVLVPDAAGRPAGDSRKAYALTGLKEAELASKVGTHVELTGVVEPADATIPSGANQPPTRGRTPGGAVGVTPEGGAAHEPGDALGGAPALAPTAPARPDPTPISIGDLARLNVQSSRSRGGSCPLPTADAAPAAPKAATVASTQTAPRAPAATPVEVTGCLRRSTEAGGNGFVLDDAVVSVAQPRVSAVPGSSPSGSGSGTVAATAPTGTTGSDARATFTLLGSGDLLGTHVGQRVKVAGTVDEARRDREELPVRSDTGLRGEVSTPQEGHPSAQARELRVRTVTEAGGRCGA